ncbi:vacuolar protein sorting-associated protein 35, putative [Entamoeba histolytica HM-1:IMSS-B]|uniref:Vacuolar protein sorting-associated protein 35 putative n=5 Tax=Entamoeba histolytica TaxID=5759 RepID=A0A175JWE0_ENTHI|nr:vacuolar protein sorting 35, putative [Entamoeba histolytica KU27]EMH77913.1 vacuolar protein sorting-associated protein 35, putative [Entamoeba histolytica HM-1:IMSS-B]EMS14708.1 vacuolar protein sorting 35, putative [Entamoeba histolytica HM-3:IMSS]ENY63760.1 vacuolar protein sorting 35, putative [Entamoeba histolytica HM-1:IMSS-A]GAT98099.1 vacuolar protein sorting-associated protein 35 putative [Entamoeba histolytica]
MSDQKSIKPIYTTEEEEINFRISSIKQSDIKMNKELDNEKIHEAIETAYNIADHLRTVTLTPKLYYSLYIEIQTIFTSLISRICEIKQKYLLKLYERVQYYSHVIPRLYLMCTIGSICIAKNEIQITLLLKDLLEMCKCVQHPSKGLFLRSYLLYVIKNYLPTTLIENNNNNNGSLDDSIQFLLTNFIEMNKLNIRLAQKQQESQVQLCQLVAMNLSILSNLDIPQNTYKTIILPQILQQIILSGEVHSQTYLIDAVIQAFPAKFQLLTLKPILRTIVTSQIGVNIVELLKSLIKQLINYIIIEKSDETDIYPLFDNSLKDALKHEENNKKEIIELLPLYIELLEHWYNKNDTLKFISKLIIDINHFIGKSCSSDLYVPIIHFLIATYQNHEILLVSQLNGFSDLMDLLELHSKHTIQRKIIQRFIQENKQLTTIEDVQFVMNITSTIHKDLENASDEDIEKDSILSTSLYQLINLNDFEEMVSTLREIKGIISIGCNKRKKISLPGLLFKFITIKPCDRKIFVGALDILKLLVKQNEMLLSIRLAIQCTLCGLNNGIDTTSFFEFATSIFENNISNAEEKKEALTYIIAGGCSMKINDEEKYIILITAVTKYSQMIEDINSRVNIIALCSALWSKRDGSNYNSKQHCLQCLQKALKDANLSNENIKLFVTILNRYIISYINGYSDFSKYIIQLRDLIQSNIGDISDNSLIQYFKNTCYYISQLDITN